MVDWMQNLQRISADPLFAEQSTWHLDRGCLQATWTVACLKTGTRQFLLRKRLTQREQTPTNSRFDGAKPLAQVYGNLRVRHAVEKTQNNWRTLTHWYAAKRQNQASTIFPMDCRGCALPLEVSDEIGKSFLSGEGVALPRP